MSLVEPGWLVAGGVALLVILGWFVPRARGEGAPSSGPAEGIVVLHEVDTVPEVLLGVAERPYKLRIIRADASREAGEISIPSLGIVRTLPANRTTTIDLELPGAGSHAIRDKGGAIRAILVVEPRATAPAG